MRTTATKTSHGPARAPQTRRPPPSTPSSSHTHPPPPPAAGAPTSKSTSHLARESRQRRKAWLDSYVAVATAQERQLQAVRAAFVKPIDNRTAREFHLLFRNDRLWPSSQARMGSYMVYNDTDSQFEEEIVENAHGARLFDVEDTDLELAQLLASSSAAFVIINRSGTIVFTSSTMESCMGTSVASITGRKVSCLHYSGTRSSLLSTVKQAFACGKPQRTTFVGASHDRTKPHVVFEAHFHFLFSVGTTTDPVLAIMILSELVDEAHPLGSRVDCVLQPVGSTMPRRPAPGRPQSRGKIVIDEDDEDLFLLTERVREAPSIQVANRTGRKRQTSASLAGTLGSSGEDDEFDGDAVDGNTTRFVSGDARKHSRTSTHSEPQPAPHAQEPTRVKAASPMVQPTAGLQDYACDRDPDTESARVLPKPPVKAEPACSPILTPHSSSGFSVGTGNSVSPIGFAGDGGIVPVPLHTLPQWQHQRGNGSGWTDNVNPHRDLAGPLVHMIPTSGVYNTGTGHGITSPAFTQHHVADPSTLFPAPVSMFHLHRGPQYHQPGPCVTVPQQHQQVQHWVAASHGHISQPSHVGHSSASGHATGMPSLY